MPTGSKKKKGNKKKKHNKRSLHNSHEGPGGKIDEVISQENKEATTSGRNMSDSAEKRIDGASENGKREGESVGEAASSCESREVSIEHLNRVKESESGESYGDDGSSNSSSDEDRRNVEISSETPCSSSDVVVFEKGMLLPEAVEPAVADLVVPLSEVASEPVQTSPVERVVTVSEEVVEVLEAESAGKFGIGEVEESEKVENLSASEVAESDPVVNSEVVQVIESPLVENSEVITATESIPVENSGSFGVVVSQRTEGNDQMPLPPSDLDQSLKARDGVELCKETESKQQCVLPVVPPLHRTSWLNCCGLFDVFKHSGQ